MLPEKLIFASSLCKYEYHAQYSAVLKMNEASFILLWSQLMLKFFNSDKDLLITNLSAP